MIRLLAAILTAMLALAAVPASAQPHPFGQSGQQAPLGAAAKEQSAPVAAEGPAGWWQTVLAMERDLRKRLADAVRGMKGGGTLPAAITLMAVSFIYGVLHAVGPGHGKAVISSYVLANGATLRRGIVLSFLAGLLQAFSAIAIFTVLAVVLNAVLRESRVMSGFDIASALLIAAAGLWFLIVHLRRMAAQMAPRPVLAGAAAGAGAEHSHHHHDHSEACGCGHRHAPDMRALGERPSLKESVAIVFAVGIRPCTGALMVLLMSRQLGVLWAGIAATFIMALGTSITVSALASLAVGSRATAVRLADSRWRGRIHDAAAVGGSLLVMLIGIALFWDALGPRPPF